MFSFAYCIKNLEMMSNTGRIKSIFRANFVHQGYVKTIFKVC